MMGYISMNMFKLRLGIHKLTIYMARGAAGLLDTTYCHPFLDPTTNAKTEKRKEAKEGKLRLK